MRPHLRLALLLTGCGGEETDAPVEATPGCLPGDVAVDGQCQPPGVPADACAPGFAPDGDAGCAPLLPPAPCPAGTIALLGETSCRPVAECGDAPWGLVAVEPGAQYVDAGYAALDSDGSAARPWRRITDAIMAAPPNGLVVVAAGDYPEHLDIRFKPVRIWGRCPDLVTVLGGTQLPAAVVVREGAPGTIVRGLGIAGPGAGVFVGGSENVTFEEVWIHDTVQRGMAIEDPFGPTSVTLRRSLIENVPRYGVSVEGVSAVIEESVLRDIAADPADDVSRGLSVKLGPVTAARANAQVSASIIERVSELGIFVEGADITVDGTLIHDMRAIGLGAGRSLSVRISTDETQPSMATVRSSVLRGAVDNGVVVLASEVAIEATVISDVAADVDGFFGRGLTVQNLGAHTGKATVTSSLIERARDCGLLAIGSELSVERSWIRSIDVDPALLDGGWGIGAQVSETDLVAPMLSVRDSRVEDAKMAGIVIVGGNASVERVSVLRTGPTPSGDFGDGVAAVLETFDASLSLSDSHIEASARAGVSAFAATVSVRGTTLECNQFDLDGEPLMDLSFSFADGGGNRCGCEAETWECKAVTSALAPPTAP